MANSPLRTLINRPATVLAAADAPTPQAITLPWITSSTPRPAAPRPLRLAR
jgi:hypothetical protein